MEPVWRCQMCIRCGPSSGTGGTLQPSGTQTTYFFCSHSRHSSRHGAVSPVPCHRSHSRHSSRHGAVSPVPCHRSHSRRGSIQPIEKSRVLAYLGDSVTTDHISPAGSIAKDSPAGRFLIENDVSARDFNSYGARRGNDRIMVRGTFANIRIRNQLTSGVEGGVTKYLPTGEVMSIYDAAMLYQAEGTPLVVLAGHDKDEDRANFRISEPLAQEKAKAALRMLLQMRTQGMSTPLPFAPYTGWTIYTADPARAESAALAKWYGNDFSDFAESASASMSFKRLIYEATTSLLAPGRAPEIASHT